MKRRTFIAGLGSAGNNHEIPGLIRAAGRDRRESAP